MTALSTRAEAAGSEKCSSRMTVRMGASLLVWRGLLHRLPVASKRVERMAVRGVELRREADIDHAGRDPRGGACARRRTSRLRQIQMAARQGARHAQRHRLAESRVG